jgi:hypothetical protein
MPIANPDPSNSKQDLLKRITDALSNLVTLEIVTAVGAVKPDADGQPELDYSQIPKMILTRINLLQGNTTTVFSEEFVTGNYQSLQAYHAAREAAGHKMIQDNIAAIKSLIGLIKQDIEGPTAAPK